MLKRVFVIGLLSVLPALGSGCTPCCPEPGSSAKSAPAQANGSADIGSADQGELATKEKPAKTRQVTVAVTGMT